jgi:hypothetical protein
MSIANPPSSRCSAAQRLGRSRTRAQQSTLPMVGFVNAGSSDVLLAAASNPTYAAVSLFQ